MLTSSASTLPSSCQVKKHIKAEIQSASHEIFLKLSTSRQLRVNTLFREFWFSERLALSDGEATGGADEGGDGEGLGVAVGRGHAGGGQPVQQRLVLSVLILLAQRPRHGLLQVIIILRVHAEQRHLFHSARKIFFMF